MVRAASGGVCQQPGIEVWVRLLKGGRREGGPYFQLACLLLAMRFGS
jgi:hypothetical protein